MFYAHHIQNVCHPYHSLKVTSKLFSSICWSVRREGTEKIAATAKIYHHKAGMGSRVVTQLEVSWLVVHDLLTCHGLHWLGPNSSLGAVTQVLTLFGMGLLLCLFCIAPKDLVGDPEAILQTDSSRGYAGRWVDDSRRQDWAGRGVAEGGRHKGFCAQGLISWNDSRLESKWFEISVSWGMNCDGHVL